MATNRGRSTSILIRVVGFDGANLRFVENSHPTAESALPLDSAYHDVARQLPRMRLCKATVLNSVIVALAPTRIRGG